MALKDKEQNFNTLCTQTGDEPHGQARPTAKKPVHNIANIAGCKIISETLRAEVRNQTKRPNKES